MPLALLLPFRFVLQHLPVLFVQIPEIVRSQVPEHLSVPIFCVTDLGLFGGYKDRISAREDTANVKHVNVLPVDWNSSLTPGNSLALPKYLGSSHQYSGPNSLNRHPHL